MSISLPSNKAEKRARLDMLVKQGSISKAMADKLYADYCELYDRVKKNECNYNVSMVDDNSRLHIYSYRENRK